MNINDDQDKFKDEQNGSSSWFNKTVKKKKFWTSIKKLFFRPCRTSLMISSSLRDHDHQ